MVALKLGLDKERVHDIGVGCLLHDLGLRYMMIEYEDQDIESLSSKELVEYKKHPVYANAIENIYTYYEDYVATLYYFSNEEDYKFLLKSKNFKTNKTYYNCNHKTIKTSNCSTKSFTLGRLNCQNRHNSRRNCKI